MRPFVRTWQAWKDSETPLRVYASVTNLPPVILLNHYIHEINSLGIVFRRMGTQALTIFTYTQIDLIQPMGE